MKRHIDSIKGPKKSQETAQSASKPSEPIVEDITPSPNSVTPDLASNSTPSAPAKTTPEPPAPAPEDTFESLFSEPTVAISGPPGWIWWTLLFIALGILGFIGYNLYNNRAPVTTPINTVTETPALTPTTTLPTEPSAEPTPTPTPTATATAQATATAVAPSSITIRVLNGSTVAGAAATAESALEKAGFTVRTIGNAKQQNYNTSIIYYQSGKKAEAELVKAALPNYSITLEESSLASPDMVLVVIGFK